MQIMVDAVDVHRVGLRGHLTQLRDGHEEFIRGQNRLHAVHAEPVGGDRDNPIHRRLRVGTLEHRGEALHVKRTLDLRGAEQHKFIRLGRSGHVTRVVLGGNDLEIIGPRSNLPQHAARVRLRTTHVV